MKEIENQTKTTENKSLSQVNERKEIRNGPSESGKIRNEPSESRKSSNDPPKSEFAQIWNDLSAFIALISFFILPFYFLGNLFGYDFFLFHYLCLPLTIFMNFYCLKTLK
jgi:hypothetical protein